MSLSSIFTRNPADSNSFLSSSHLAKTSSFPFLNKIGMIVICFGEISGGRRNPFSSP